MQINHTQLEKLIEAIFLANGSNEFEAHAVADHLVKANLAGHDSHGVIRTPIYVQWLQDGKVFANRQVKVLFENQCMTSLDGQLGMGQSIGKQAMDIALEKCRNCGVSVTALRNSGHLGRIGHWSELAIEAGFVAINFVNTSGLGMHVVPAGGVEHRLSVNPINIGSPMKDGYPLVLDMAAAATAEGKLKVARNKGVPVPDNWIIDADGNPTNDPNDFYASPGGAILPFGGHKGYGLGFMAELLAGALTGGGCSSEGKTRLEQGMLSIVIDPDRLETDAFDYQSEVSRYAKFVKSAKPRDPDGEVLTPGEVEQRNRERKMRDGVDLDDNTWSQLVATAKECQVPEEIVNAADQQ